MVWNFDCMIPSTLPIAGVLSLDYMQVCSDRPFEVINVGSCGWNLCQSEADTLVPLRCKRGSYFIREITSGGGVGQSLVRMASLAHT
jgi:hypothetical protein